MNTSIERTVANMQKPRQRAEAAERERDELRAVIAQQEDTIAVVLDRIAALEAAVREDVEDAKAVCGGDGEGCESYRPYFDSAERRHRKCGQCPMDATSASRRALEGSSDG